MQVLDFKTGIDFGARGNLKEFGPIGLSPKPDDASTWSVAATAGVTFGLSVLRHDLHFSVQVFPYLGNGKLPRQDCFIYINGLFVHYEIVNAPIEMTFTATRNLLNSRANRLSFALPNATSPSELSLGEDLRLLGLAFVKLSATV